MNSKCEFESQLWKTPKAKARSKLIGPSEIKPLAVTYSRMRMHTTIGAGAFHFRVREGIGWFHTAMAARETLESRCVARTRVWDLGCEEVLRSELCVWCRGT